jgi:hypothetical protein
MHDVFYIFLNLRPNSSFPTLSIAMLTKTLSKQIFKRYLYEHILPQVLFAFKLYSYLLLPLRKMRENWRSGIYSLWTNACSVKLKFCDSRSRHVSDMNRRMKLSTFTCSYEYVISSSKAHFNSQNMCYEIHHELIGICTRVSRICRRCVMWKKVEEQQLVFSCFRVTGSGSRHQNLNLDRREILISPTCNRI